MPSLDGATEWFNGEVKSEALAGKPTLVYFWAVSCYICKNNMPTIGAWKKEFADQVNFVSVHMPRQESDTDLDAVKKIMAEFGIDEPVAVDGYHEIGERFQTQGYWPYYFLFDADGNLKSRAAGDVGLKSIEGTLNRLINPEPAPVA